MSQFIYDRERDGILRNPKVAWASLCSELYVFNINFSTSEVVAEVVLVLFLDQTFASSRKLKTTAFNMASKFLISYEVDIL